MPIAEHERAVEAARGQQRLPQRHGRAGGRAHGVPYPIRVLKRFSAR